MLMGANICVPWTFFVPKNMRCLCLLCFYFFCSEVEVSFCLLHASKLGMCNVIAAPSKIVVYSLNAKAFIQFDLISNCDSISWSLHYFTFLKILSYCDHWCIVYAKAAKCTILTKQDLQSSQSDLLTYQIQINSGSCFSGGIIYSQLPVTLPLP